MIARLAILFAGLIIAGAMMNVYLFATLALVYPLEMLGVRRGVAFGVLYCCLAAGFVTAIYLLRPVWPRDPSKDRDPKQPPDETAESSS